MKVEQVMNRQVHTCRADQTLNQAVHVFWEKDCGAAPVVDNDNKLIGMLTDRDVCMAAYFRGENLHNLWVGDTMARNVLAVRASDAIEDAVDLMRTHQIRRLPVVDVDGRVQGILSLSDLFRASARDGEIKPKKLVKAFAAICGWREERRSIVLELELKPTEKKPAKPAPTPKAAAKSAPKSKKSRAPAKKPR